MSKRQDHIRAQPGIMAINCPECQAQKRAGTRRNVETAFVSISLLTFAKIRAYQKSVPMRTRCQVGHWSTVMVDPPTFVTYDDGVVKKLVRSANRLLSD